MPIENLLLFLQHKPFNTNTMDLQQYKEENELLRKRLAEMEKTVQELVSHNMKLSQQMELYYDVRRRIYVYQELLLRHSEFIKFADLRNDDELMGIIESRLENEKCFENPDFGLKELAELVGTSQSRILQLFHNSLLFKSVDDYLDYLRLLRSMHYLMSKPEWSIAACAQEAGFSAIRTFNRKFQEAIGMSPNEFRRLLPIAPEEVSQK